MQVRILKSIASTNWAFEPGQVLDREEIIAKVGAPTLDGWLSTASGIAEPVTEKIETAEAPGPPARRKR